MNPQKPSNRPHSKGHNNPSNRSNQSSRYESASKRDDLSTPRGMKKGNRNKSRSDRSTPSKQRTQDQSDQHVGTRKKARRDSQSFHSVSYAADSTTDIQTRAQSTNTTPNTLDVVDFAVARAYELRSLRSAVQNISGNRRVYQQLSWHARRRTMSHSSRRMPIKLRRAHASQLAKQRPAGTSERPPGPLGKARVRKYRKKARFLAATRRLRSKKSSCLETHLWHAKRFHMTTLGERKVADWCNDRGFRSCYRAATRASLLHDESYLTMLELHPSSKDVLKQFLRRHLSPEDARRACVDPATTGARFVHDLVLLDASGGAITPMDLLWRAEGGTSQLIESGQESLPSAWVWIRPEAATLGEDILLPIGATIAKLPMNRFLVLGPRAGAVIGGLLRSRQRGVSKPSMSEVSLAIAACATSHSSRCLPRGAVVSTEIPDPRATFPPKTMAAAAADVGKDFGKAKFDEDTAISPLWIYEKRENLHQRAAKGLSAQELREKAPRMQVPFLGVQQSVLRGGFLLLIPPGWGMPFWLSLAYATGARAAGVLEMGKLRRESRLSVFPNDFPDTVAGATVLEGKAMDARELYDKKPPGKRVNYAIHRVKNPFEANYIELRTTVTQGKTIMRPNEKEEEAEGPQRKQMGKTKGLSTTDTDNTKEQEKTTGEDEMNTESISKNLHVLRGPTTLQSRLGNTIYEKLLPRRRKLDNKPVIESEKVLESADDGVVSLVSISLRPCGRGVPQKLGLVCEPTKEEVKIWLKEGAKAFNECVESKGTGPPKRKVVGRVVDGEFSLGRGEGLATAFVELDFLRNIVSRQIGEEKAKDDGKVRSGVVVLFRNIDSLQYRPAVATLLL